MMIDTSISDVLIGVAVDTFIAVVCLGVVYKVWGRTIGLPQPNKILPFQRGVLVKGEVVERILDPGTHWISPKRTAFLCDMRPKPFQVAGVDVLTDDKRWLRISLKGETVIDDAGKYVTASGDSRGTFYIDLRQVLHEFVGKQSSYVFSGDKDVLAASLTLALSMSAAALGLRLTKLEVWEMMLLGWHQLPIEPDSDEAIIH